MLLGARSHLGHQRLKDLYSVTQVFTPCPYKTKDNSQPQIIAPWTKKRPAAASEAFPQFAFQQSIVIFFKTSDTYLYISNVGESNSKITMNSYWKDDTLDVTFSKVNKE